MTTITELKSILKTSEAHALTCPIDYGFSSHLFHRQMEKGYLSISVSKKRVKDAIKALNIFLRRMLKEGFSITVDSQPYYRIPASTLIVDGEMIPIRMKERSKFTEIVDKKWGNQRKATPTGVLSLEIYGDYWTPTKILTASKDKSWEELAEGVIPYLLKVSKKIKSDRLLAQERKREKEEEERIKREHQERIKERADIAKAIMKDIWLFEKAETIKRYCDIAEQKTCSEEYKKRIEIARSVADWINPTTDYVDVILSEMYRKTDFL